MRKKKWLMLLIVCALATGMGSVFSRSSEPELGLTQEERTWLGSHQTIRVCPNPSFVPFEFYDTTGAYIGLSADLLAVISKRLGISIVVVRIDSREERMTAAREKKIDLLGAVKESPDRSQYLLFTSSIAYSQDVIVTLNKYPHALTVDSLNNKRVAVAKGNTIHEELKNNYPQIHIISEESGYSPHERAAIDKKWIGLQADVRWWDRLPWQWITGGMVMLSLLMIVVLMWNRSLKRLVQSKTEELEQELYEHCMTEDKLRKSEDRYKHLFEDAPVGYHETDHEGRIVQINSTELRMLGYASGELIMQPVWTLVADEEMSRTAVLAKLAGAGASAQSYERVFRRKDGSTIPVHVEDRILRHDDGSIAGIRTVVQDVTERKRLEQQLLQAQKLEGMGMLAGGIAHDFNNLLAMILGSAELLRRQMTEQPALSTYVERILEAAERGTSISRQLLMFSRPDQGQLSPISISQTISELRDMLSHFLPKSVAIETVMETEHGMVMGDAGQIHQALLNLAINAGDAMAGSGVLTIKEFSVTAEFMNARFSTATSATYVAVSVSDTGTGMDASTLGKIFDPFFSTKEAGKGTGLGLAMVHGIMKNHNGLIDVASVPDMGSTFTLYFPAAPSQKHTAVPAEVPPAQKQQGTILLVDDEQSFRELMSEYLVDSGYRVHLAGNGVEALTVFREHRTAIDLVITDIGMPEMNGEDLYRELRRIDASVKVIVSSGYLDGTTKKSLLDEGISGVLTKPYRFVAIGDEITRVLGN